MSLHIKPDVIAAIGGTTAHPPCARRKRQDREILGKAEISHPGQSVKDRARAFHYPGRRAPRPALRAGGTIVEALPAYRHRLAVVANAMGFRTVIVIPTKTQRWVRNNEWEGMRCACCGAGIGFESAPEPCPYIGPKTIT